MAWPADPLARSRHGSGKSRVLASWKSLPSVAAGVILLALALLSFSWRPDPDGHKLLVQHQQHIVTGTSADQKLLLATHGRLFWYHIASNTITVLHEGEQNVHYGVFPGAVSTDGELLSVWYVHRPHNWHPKTTEEALVEVDASTGVEISRRRINARFTHDAVRAGNNVYLCSTESGEVLQLRYPDMTEVQRMKLFTYHQHINTLSPISQTGMWVMAHNFGSSSIVHVDMTAGQAPAVVGYIPQVGQKAHGVVQWQDWLLFLDSEGSGLARVRASEEKALLVGTLDAALKKARRAQVEMLYTVPEPSKFLKGLCVVDDVAYFGISVFAKREARDDPEADSVLAAYDLITNKLLWRRKVPTHGLLNVIAAPHLSEASSYKAVSSSQSLARQPDQTEPTTLQSDTDATSSTHSAGSGGGGGGGGGGAQVVEMAQDLKASVEAVTKQLNDMGFPAVVGGHWESGQPFLDLGLKSSLRSWSAGIQLPMMQLDVSGVQAALESMPPEWWSDDFQKLHNAAVAGRDDNMNKFKPGISTMFLIFSDRTIKRTYMYPFYEHFRSVLEPIIKQIIGASEMRKIVRLQFANMPPNSVIHMHRDMGGYAVNAHRIHIPIHTNPDVKFQVCPGLEKRIEGKHLRVTDDDVTHPDDCVNIPMSQGMVFELNNRVLHRVVNTSPTKSRIQLVVDVAERHKPMLILKPGTQCTYVHGSVYCPDGSYTEVK